MTVLELNGLSIPKWLQRGFFQKFAPSHQAQSPKPTRCAPNSSCSRLIWHENHSLEMIIRHWKKLCKDDFADRYEHVKQNDIALIYADDDTKVAYQIETALRRFCPNVRIMKSECITPGDSLYSFYEKMLSSSSYCILILSKNLISNNFFSVIASEIVTTNKVAYFNVDNAYKEHKEWSWIVRDIVTKGDVSNLENWARKFICLLERNSVFLDRIKRETASVNEEIKRVSLFVSE